MNSPNIESLDQNELPDLTNPSLEDAPIINLLNRAPHEMSDEEVDALVNSTRKLATSAQSRTAAVKNTTPKAAKPKIDLSQYI